MAIRVYADTSVFGGVFDLGIDRASLEFFEQIGQGRFELVTSNVVADERCVGSRTGATSI